MYDHYRGRSIGRLLAFIYYYCGLHHAERVCGGDGKSLTYWGKTFCTYTWDGDTDIPTFTFLHDPQGLYKRNQDETKVNLIRDLKKVEVKPIEGRGWVIFDEGRDTIYEYNTANDAWLAVAPTLRGI